MNVFVTDPDPIKSAVNLPDKLIVKMPVESCQMMSIVLSDWYPNYPNLPLLKVNGNFYKTEKGAHRNHPCTKWIGSDYRNFVWLVAHAMGLCLEYTKRYKKEHGCVIAIRQIIASIEQAKNPASTITQYYEYYQDPTNYVKRIKTRVRVMHTKSI